MRPLLGALAALLLATPIAAQTTTATAATYEPAPSDAMLIERGRQLTAWLLAGEADSIHALLTEASRTKVGGRDGILQMSAKLAMALGSETALVEEKLTRRNGNRQYWRAATFDLFVAEPFVFRWVFDASGMVMGAGLNPLSQAPAPDP
ncbi:MAG TPA: hypothetical protein VFY20_12755 [Gemmatimonadales bacterium]|nr:hypothetical protein [Gemmatimonadales bacterium]